MNDSELERIAARLGDRAAARLDVEQTAAAVLSRLRTREQVVSWRAGPMLLRLAAALVLAVGAAFYGYRLFSGDSVAGTEVATVEVPALQTLASSELEEVLDSLSTDTPASEAIAVGLQSLNNDQLTELLRQMEG
jgi:hypothetical protein